MTDDRPYLTADPAGFEADLRAAFAQCAKRHKNISTEALRKEIIRVTEVVIRAKLATGELIRNPMFDGRDYWLDPENWVVWEDPRVSGLVHFLFSRKEERIQA